ncbi:MAG: hypothetical protein JXC85_00905 [Candidatus Aenigmarchaeota archaeon]|nr:hypothetical protein [Candidatus Aenigmarchaeota archaeon]
MLLFRKKRRLRELLLGASLKIRLRIRHFSDGLDAFGDKARLSMRRVRRLERSARYAADDAGRGVRKLSRHTEAMLFSTIIALGIIMLVNAGNANFLNSLIALLLLVLVVVIYAQLKFQQRMLEQYIPRLDYVKVGSCRLYSDRVRTINLYGAKERISEINTVRNAKVRYHVVNTSFSPVSVQAASLSLRLAGGKSLSVPGTISVLDVGPKRASSSEASFRLRSGVDFRSIERAELILKGNCEKAVRLEPRLYVNIILRGKKQDMIFEPFDKFRKRPEIAIS